MAFLKGQEQEAICWEIRFIVPRKGMIQIGVAEWITC